MSNEITKIRLNSAEDTFQVRQFLLRLGTSAAECEFPGDHLEESFQLGCLQNDQPTGIANYMPGEDLLFKSIQQFRLRGTAVIPEARKQNIGEQLLLKGESILKKKNGQLLLWFNAREDPEDLCSGSGYGT